MRRFPFSLTLVSSLPFIIIGIAVSLRAFDDNEAAIRWLLTYAAIILSFLGGIHWGIAIMNYSHNKTLSNLLIAESILPSMIAWWILFHALLHIQLLILTILFTCIWAIDSVLISRKVIPLWFFEIRCIITPIVVVSLYVAYFGII